MNLSFRRVFRDFGLKTAASLMKILNCIITLKEKIKKKNGSPNPLGIFEVKA